MHKFFSKKILAAFLFFLLYFVVCEMIVRYESFGTIAFSYDRIKAVGPITSTDLIYDMARPDTCLFSFIPNKTGYFRGAVFQTNSFGMRDKEYSLLKPKNTFRIIVIGDSISLGPGVPIDGVYHSILEDMLNSDDNGIQYEIINWGMPFNSNDCLLAQMEYALAYSPDMVFLTMRPALEQPVFNNKTMIQEEDYLQDIFNFQKRTGIAMLLTDFRNLLSDPARESLSIHPLYLNLTIPYGSEDYIYPADFHPNARVHALYAKALYKFFSDHKKEIFNQSHPKSITVELPKVDPIPNSRYKNGFFESYYAEKISQKFKKIAVWK